MNSPSLSRRRFLKRSALAAAPLILPSGAWSASLKGSGPNSRINLGLIGMGRRMQSLIRAFARLEETQIIAVNDVVDARTEDGLQRVLKEYAKLKRTAGDITRSSDFRDILANPSVDAVVIATPDHWHALQSILAARAGKHIYCEKPLTRTIEEGRQVVQAARTNKVVYQAGSQQRTEYDGKFRRAVEYIRNGRIGELKRVYVGVNEAAIADDLPDEPLPPGIDWDMWLGPAPRRGFNQILCPIGVHSHFPQFRKYREYAGGSLSDMGAHHFDIVQWAMDMDHSGPVEVTPPQQGNDGLILRYANGVEVIHQRYQDRSGSTFIGTEGELFVDRPTLQTTPGSILEKPLGKGDWKLEEIASTHQQNWIDCIHSGRRPVADVEIAHRTNTVCQLANIGYWERKVLKWDPEKERFSSNRKANQWLQRNDRSPWNKV